MSNNAGPSPYMTVIDARSATSNSPMNPIRSPKNTLGSLNNREAIIIGPDAHDVEFKTTA